MIQGIRSFTQAVKILTSKRKAGLTIALVMNNPRLALVFAKSTAITPFIRVDPKGHCRQKNE
jgi:hypothetical protein